MDEQGGRSFMVSRCVCLLNFLIDCNERAIYILSSEVTGKGNG